jgi:hypothetical protein
MVWGPGLEEVVAPLKGAAPELFNQSPEGQLRINPAQLEKKKRGKTVGSLMACVSL